MTPFLEKSPLAPRRWPLLVGLSVLAAVAVAMFLPADLLLTTPGTDLTGQFVAWRAFAADNLRAGHLPLWNPYTYAGEPFLGDFQSALLYPPNVIFLFLPLARAINLSILLHLLLLGWGMVFWATRRGLHPGAAALCGFVIMLSGPVFPHVYAGHLSNLCSMAWAPWILGALEIAWRGKNFRALLFAAAAICLQILAGNVQYVFYTGIAAGLLAVVCSGTESSIWRRALPMVAIAYGLGAALAAAQLLPGYAAAAEGVRQGKLEYAFVRMFSFPPENLLTLIVPGFYGNLTTAVYWGRAFLWEMSLFAGVSGLVLALVALAAKHQRRAVWADFALVVLLFLLALGDHTPLLRILYDYVPGFGQFRGLSKFTFPAMLFGVLIIGAGADSLIRGKAWSKSLAVGLLVAGLFAGLAGVYLRLDPAAMAGALSRIAQSHESYLPTEKFSNPEFIAVTGHHAGTALLIAAGLYLLVGMGFLLAPRWPRLRWTPLVLLPLEMLCFARANIASAHMSDCVSPELHAFVAAHPGDYRVLNPMRANNGFVLGAPDLWGNNPSLLKRYAEFITFTQGGDPAGAGEYVNFRVASPLFSLVRFRYAFIPDENGFKVLDYPGALPQALLASDYHVLPGCDAIFAALSQPGFDPRKTVLLESEPNTRPQPGGEAGTVRVVDSTSDTLTLEADTPAPALLLVTDVYSRDWRARALSGSAQTHYDILPADYILRAIPLSSGHHVLRLEYAPPSFRTGVIVSAVSWLAWLVLMFMLGRGNRRHEPA